MTGKSNEGYGYYDETGYYYNGQWYSYADEQNYSADQYAGYDQTYESGYDYGNDYSAQEFKETADPQKQPQQPQQQPQSAATPIKDPSPRLVHQQSSTVGPDFKNDVAALKRRALLHGDLSSSGGSAESEHLAGMMHMRRESSASVTTPTADLRAMESPLGELDRLQSDLISHRLSMESNRMEDSTAGSMLRGISDSRMSDRRMGSDDGLAMSPIDPRRGSTQSRLSQMSRRERHEEFRRRRSSSIDREQELDDHHPRVMSPYNSYEENERTPVNDPRLSADYGDMTPVNMTSGPDYSRDDIHASAYRQDSVTSQRKSVSFEETDKSEPLPLSPPPGQDLTSVISAPPTVVDRPKLTARQRWLWAFNKICAQLVSPRSLVASNAWNVR